MGGGLSRPGSCLAVRRRIILLLCLVAAPGSGAAQEASGYDPGSSTGIVFVRRDWSAVEMVWSLHRTGLHP